MWTTFTTLFYVIVALLSPVHGYSIVSAGTDEVELRGLEEGAGDLGPVREDGDLVHRRLYVERVVLHRHAAA